LREKIMPKRFTDTNTWHQTWFLELSPESKIIWTYLKDNCDCAGIWKIDLPAMKREIGFKSISLATFLSEVNRDYDTKTGDQLTRNRVMIISNENKLWMTGFITFQYEKGTNGVNANIPAIKDKSGLLLERTWNKWKILPEERRLVNEYISKYGIDAVDFAFREGVKYNKMNLAYVDAICRKRKEKSDLAEYKDRDKKKLKESILKAEEQRKSGKCLTLVRDVYGEIGLRKTVGGEG